VLKRLLKLRIGLLTFDRDAEQSSKAGKNIGVSLIKLAGIRAIDFKYGKKGLAVTAVFYEHVDCAPDAWSARS
jgi:hypothetical protein